MIEANLDDLRLARLHPGWFARLASNRAWEPAEHLVYLCERLMAVERGDVKRLMISFPPGFGKSWCTSRYFPPWYLGRNPTHRMIFITYQHGYAREWGEQVRDILAEFGPRVFGVWASPNASAERFRLYTVGGQKTGGGYIAAGAQAGVTGRRAEIIVVDDPMKGMEDALSPTIRAKILRTFLSVIETRLMPGGRVIIIQTRWHEADLMGALLKMEEEDPSGDPWEVINLPAIAMEPGDIFGREVGESLWPSLWTEKELAIKKKKVGPYVWASLFQGRPTDGEASIFKRAWFQAFDRRGDDVVFQAAGRTFRYALEDCIRFGVADLAVTTKETSDHTVVGSFALTPCGRLLLFDLDRQRLEGPDIVPLLTEVVERNDLDVIWIEATAFQVSIVQAATRAGLPARKLVADKNKLARSLPAQAAYAAGEIFHARKPWRKALELELSEFPRGQDDDQVDVVSYAVRVAMDLRRKRKPVKAVMAGGAGGAKRERYVERKPTKFLRRDKVRPHYFRQGVASSKDTLLGMARMQQYVPDACLLGGATVMLEVNAGRDPCAGCEGPRNLCEGRPKREHRALPTAD